MQTKKERKPIYSILIEHREIPLLAVLALLLVAVSIRVPGYLGNSWLNVLKNGSINMVLCCGMLCVLLIGSIDISITAILAFAGAVAGKLMGDGAIQSTLLMFLLGIAIGAAVGALNGVLMSYGRVIALIVTLSTSYIIRALIPMDWLLGMNKINPTQLTQGFKDSLINHSFLGLPFLVWLAALVVIITGVFLKYTRTGRNLYAVGSNAEAAQMTWASTRMRLMGTPRICAPPRAWRASCGWRSTRPSKRAPRWVTRCSPSRPACWAAWPSPAATARSAAWSSAL